MPLNPEPLIQLWLRYHKDMLERLPQRIDKLYIDNTFGHRKYDFPSRADAAQRVVELIRQHPSHEVFLGLSSTYIGKEELLLAVALGAGLRIGVSAERRKIFETVGGQGWRELLVEACGTRSPPCCLA